MEDKQRVSNEPVFLTVKQAAHNLNVSMSCVYRLCSIGKLPHYKFGDGQGAVRISRDDLLDMIQRCRIEKEEGESGTGQRRKPVKPTGYVYKHLFVQEKHACGGTTKAGTPCTRLTSDERCRQHRG